MFPKHLLKLLQRCKLSGSLKSGFEKTGIYPFSCDVIHGTVPVTSVSIEASDSGATVSAGVDIVVNAFCDRFVKNVPEKKPKCKDTRIKNTFGIVLNKPEYKAALEKRKNESRSKQVLRNANTGTNSTEGPKRGGSAAPKPVLRKTKAKKAHAKNP